MKNTWIVVANGSAGKILHQKKHDDPITTVHTFSHLRTAKKAASIDEQGKTQPPVHAIDYDQNMEEHERQVFAKEIAHFLIQALNQHRFDNLILVASRDLLGELRKELSPQLENLVIHEMSKDLLSQHLTDAELIEKILEDVP